MPVSIAQRKLLAKKGLMACPLQLKYPLDTRKHTLAAIAYYAKKGDTHCKGGLARIKKAAKKFGINMRQK